MEQYWLFFACFLPMTPACSTKSNSSAGSDASATLVDAQADCTPSQQRPYDARNQCFSAAVPAVGLCFQKPPPPNTTGLEAVCAADGKGHLFVIITETDVKLSGPGWTFGSRAAPGIVNQMDTLSASDEQECSAAQAAVIGVSLPECHNDGAADSSGD